MLFCLLAVDRKKHLSSLSLVVLCHCPSHLWYAIPAQQHYISASKVHIQLLPCLLQLCILGMLQHCMLGSAYIAVLSENAA